MKHLASSTLLSEIKFIHLISYNMKNKTDE